MLELHYFHTKLREQIDRKATINHCLAEYLFPQTNFSIGLIYSKGTVDRDLQPFQNQTLQFSSGERMYFANENVGELLYPNPSDRIAYGSLPFTPCLTVKKLTARILIIDDETGENGGHFNRGEALNWVGDCFGRVSKTLCDALIGQVDRPFQFRLGISPQPDSPVYRIAKGTLAPTNLDSLIPYQSIDVSHHHNNIHAHIDTIDLVLPLSSFKGRKDEHQLLPGIYNWSLHLGIKALAQYRKHSLGTQVLVNYPHGVKNDILPIVKQQAEELMRVQQDIVSLAHYYLDTRKKQKPVLQEQHADWQKLLVETFTQFIPEEHNEILIDHLIEQDLANHCQLLEHPRVMQHLRSFVRKQWLDIATGRSIKFASGMAQPSLCLADDEVYIPKLPLGKNIIISRSPLLNSNGVIILKNTKVKDTAGKKGTVYINPETAAKHLQGDFDGDFLFFALADDYPSLAEDINRAIASDYRYPPIIKPEKKPYKGDFSRIACEASTNQIGIIANQIQRAITLRWELQFLASEKQPQYLLLIRNHYRKLDSNSVPDDWKPLWRNICNLPERMGDQQRKQAANTVTRLLFSVVGVLSNQLQVAADGFKSQARPDSQVLKLCRHLSSYRQVAWIQEKKNPKVYEEQPLKSINNSPIDWMIKTTNNFYEKCPLTPLPLVTFRGLFYDIKYTKEQERKAWQIKDEYNHRLAKASRLKQKLGKNQEPSLVVKITEKNTRTNSVFEDDIKVGGIPNSHQTGDLCPSLKPQQSFTVERILDYAEQNQEIWQQQSLNIWLIPDLKRKNRLRAIAMDKSGKDKYTIGLVTPKSQQEYQRLCGQRFFHANYEIDKGVTEREVQAEFEAVSEYVQTIRQSLSEEEVREITSAMWHLSHPVKSAGNTSTGCCAMAIFPDIISTQLEKPPLDLLKVVGIHQPTNAYHDRIWTGELVNVEIEQDNHLDSPLCGKRVVLIDGEVFAPLASDSPHLLAGMSAQAHIHTIPGSTITATTSNNNTLTVKRRKHYSPYQWQGEEVICQLEKEQDKQDWILTYEGEAIGSLDKDSIKKLQKHHLLKDGQSFCLSLQSSKPTTAYVQVVSMNCKNHIENTLSLKQTNIETELKPNF